MKTGWKSVLWSGAALLLLLSLMVPLINFVTLPLVMVPFVVLYALLPRKSFAVHAAAVVAVVGAITYPLLGLSYVIVAIFFLIPAIAMGHFYQQKAPASKVIRMITVLILMELMAMLLLLQVVFDISLIKELRVMLRGIPETMAATGMLPSGWNDNATEQLVRLFINVIPVTFIILAFVLTVSTQYAARWIVNQSGASVPGFPEGKDWRLPRGLVLIYFIAYIAQLMTSTTSDSFMAIALFNLVPLLQYVFAIQAVGFFFFIAHERGWHKVVPVLIAIPVLLISPLSLIGVLDTAFPIRNAFKKKS